MKRNVYVVRLIDDAVVDAQAIVPEGFEYEPNDPAHEPPRVLYKVPHGDGVSMVYIVLAASLTAAKMYVRPRALPF